MAFTMRFSLPLALSIALVVVLPAGAGAQHFGASGATKENLDLPFDALGEEQEEEDAPEIVVFYDQVLEGDGLFYAVDRSGSMQESGELNIAKEELIRNINEFSERVEFGIVFFDAGVNKFPASGQPARAHAGMKASARSFVQGMPGSHGSCCQQGIAAALQMANMSSSRRKILVYLGDGGGTCHGANESTYLRTAIAALTAQNYQRVQINTIGILDPGPINEDFMRQLAAANNGTYTRKR